MAHGLHADDTRAVRHQMRCKLRSGIELPVDEIGQMQEPGAIEVARRERITESAIDRVENVHATFTRETKRRLAAIARLGAHAERDAPALAPLVRERRRRCGLKPGRGTALPRKQAVADQIARGNIPALACRLDAP